MDQVKICSKCKERKWQWNFYKDKTKPSGLSAYCKDCKLQQGKQYWKKYKEPLTAQNKEWKEKNHHRMQILMQRWSWKKSGITMTEELYQKLWKQQNGKCAICGFHQILFKKRLAVDHNHKTGQVRGLLCGNCNNKVVKVLEDYSYLIEPALRYLKFYV
jgi:nitrate/TMAO reductase-like tetraheme cytochrome c subunit